MDNSRRTIYAGMETSLKELEEKTKDSASSRRANIWYPLALEVNSKTAVLYEYIEGLKKEVEEGEGLGAKQSEMLEKRIYNYRDDILGVHDHIDSAFRQSMFSKEYFDASGKYKEGFVQSYFENASKTSAIAMLNNFQHVIRIIENRAVMFCNNKVSSGCGFYYLYEFVVAQNSNIVQPGETIEITAGMGGFSVACDPEVIIGGEKVPFTKNAAAIYKIKAPSRPGNYTIPVKIKYTDTLSHRSEYMTKEVRYTVAGGK